MAAKSFLGTNYVPGIRNNNPGNIRPGDNWIGMTGTENNTEAYIAQVEKVTGFDENKVLTPDASTIKKLMFAISQHEIGAELWNKLLTSADIEAGYAMVPMTTAVVQATKDFFVKNPVV